MEGKTTRKVGGWDIVNYNLVSFWYVEGQHAHDTKYRKTTMTFILHVLTDYCSQIGGRACKEYIIGACAD